MKIKQVLFTVLISAVTAFAVMFAYSKMRPDSEVNSVDQGRIPANYAGFFNSDGKYNAPSDFVEASKAAIPAVVHIKTKTAPKKASVRQRSPFSDLFGDDDPWSQFFGGPRGGQSVPQMASGSGVIISGDGYIITNNHVVAGADEVTVTTSNKKTYTAKVVGADPNFDLAVVKIKAQNLPHLVYGNSENVQIGQWVLAIGYPLTLDATVTAGIVSAKARTLGLNRGKDGSNNYAVESYIQTDAAVNMGNSGGALINTAGQLIGINSAIASPTGYYSGYSYAIPSDLVKKVTNDLIKYGNVQRGFLGIMFLDVTDDMPDELLKQNDIPKGTEGLYVTDLVKNGGAAKAGIKIGDVIRAVNGKSVNGSAQLQQEISLMRPGDKVKITYERGGKNYTTTVTLQNSEGNLDLVKAPTSVDKLGADLATIDTRRAKENGIDGGVVVKKINKGVLNDQTRMRDGFIITEVDGKSVKNLDEFNKAIANKNQVTVSGVYPGYSDVFEYPLDLSVGY